MTVDRLDVASSAREFGSAPVNDPVLSSDMIRRDVERERERQRERVVTLRRRLQDRLAIDRIGRSLLLLGILGLLIVVAVLADSKAAAAVLLILVAASVEVGRRARAGIGRDDHRWFLVFLGLLGALLSVAVWLGVFSAVLGIVPLFLFVLIRNWLDLLAAREEEPNAHARAMRRRHLVMRRLLPAAGLVLGLLWTEQWWTRPRPIGVRRVEDCGAHLRCATIVSSAPIGGESRPHGVVLWRGTTAVPISETERTRVNGRFQARLDSLWDAGLQVVANGDAEIIYRDRRREVDFAGRTFSMPYRFDVLVIMLDARGSPPHWELADTVTIPSRGLRDARQSLSLIAARSPAAASFIASAIR